jgi:site-specific recombinase XerD
MAGNDLRTVQELMGHKTMSMTVRYAHLSAPHKRDAVQSLKKYRQKSEPKDPKK